MSTQPKNLDGPITLASATPGKPLTAEEKQKLFAELRERMGESRLKVEGPAHLHPCWARKLDVSEIARLQYLGYEIVHDDPKKPVWKANGLREDGTYELGDVILMSCPQEVYEFLEQEQHEKSIAWARGYADSFTETAQEAKVPVFAVAKEKAEKRR